MAAGSANRLRAWGLAMCGLTLNLVLGGMPCLVRAQPPDHAKPIGGFGELRRGDAPEGTLETMTPRTDGAIEYGTARSLIISQNPNDYLPIFQR